MFTGRLAVLARLRRPERRPFFTGKSPREKTNYKRSLPVWTVDKSGDVLRAELSKHAVLEAFPSVLARDLRTLDDRRRMISEILVREQALVFKVEHLRVVVNRSRAVIFDAEQPVVTAFAAKLGEELVDTMTRQADAVGMANVACALELSVLECVLAAVAENFDHRFSLLDTITRQLLRNVASQSFDEAAQRLVPVKRSIATLHTALDEYRAALAAVVADPKALSGLYLPGHTHPEHARDAVAAAEIALSDHIKRAEELLNELEDLREGVLSAEATATQSLASTRNNLMSLNLQISLASLGFSTAACGFSAFGMNLPTGFETTPGSFYWATLGVGACSVAVWSIGMSAYTLMRGRYFRVRNMVAPSVAIFNQINSPGAVYDLFREVHLRPGKTRDLMQTALGRVLTDAEFERAQVIANKDEDPHLSVSEVLRFLQELGEKDSSSSSFKVDVSAPAHHHDRTPRRAVKHIQ